jgi:Domain of unknown function (DUF397)
VADSPHCAYNAAHAACWAIAVSDHRAPQQSLQPQGCLVLQMSDWGVTGDLAARRRGEAGVTDFQGSAIVWRKSTASNSGACVEVAFIKDWVLIRDSLNPKGGVLRFSPAAWNAFLDGVKNSELSP